MAGLTKAGSTTKNDSNFSQNTQVAPVSAQEQALRDQLFRHGQTQQEQLQQLFQRYNQFQGDNSFALTQPEQDQLNQAYAGAEANLRRYGQIMGQDLAGTRGLNTSDTPVSEAVLREVMPAMAQLQGQKMQTGLGMKFQNRGLNLSGLNSWNNAVNSMPTASLNLMNSMQQDRLASTSSSGMANEHLGMPWIERLGKGVKIVQGMMDIAKSMQGMGGGA